MLVWWFLLITLSGFFVLEIALLLLKNSLEVIAFGKYSVVATYVNSFTYKCSILMVFKRG